MAEFVAPEFIDENDVESIHERMMAVLPDDIDDMPGGFPYDFTMPTAIVKSELIQYQLVQTLMLMFPMWAWGEWLDLHGSQAGLTRKEAGYARGYVTIEGSLGTVIEKGFGICTQATDSAPSVSYIVDESIVIPEDGSVTLPITAEEPGTVSNVLAGTITLMLKPIDGITSILNAERITGGTDEETDDAFRIRINEANESEGSSYIGNDSDYKRWAKEVVGIGDCIVIPTWNGPGTVKLALVDSNGQPANDQLVTDVYNHIVSPSDRSKRLLPTGCAELTVVAADTKLISYSCENLVFDSSTNLERVIADFKESLILYYYLAKNSNLVRYNQVHAILSNISGVLDFDNFRMDDSTDNIVLDGYEYAATDKIIFNS